MTMPARKRDAKPPAATQKRGGKRRTHLTTHRIVSAMRCLNNERGSTLASIKRKLENSLGVTTEMHQVRLAMQRAIKSGLVNEVVEDRYKVPRQKGAQPVAATSSSRRRAPSQSGLAVSSNKRLGPGGPGRASRSRRVQRRRDERALRAKRQRAPMDAASNDSSDADDEQGHVDAGDGSDHADMAADRVDKGMEEAVVVPVAACDAVPTYA